MVRNAATVTILVILAALCATGFAVADVAVEKADNKVVVKLDGQPFAEYLTCSGTQPIVWPIIGPTGKAMTRAHPMGEAPGERKDHPHHRSMWFTHGNVNGVNFWEGKESGIIKHREFAKVEGGKIATIVTINDWIGPDGKRVCEDQRTLRFGAAGDARWIDFDITLKAADGPVTFGDTKEGTMAVRVAETMKVDAKQGGKIVNSEGQTDRDAWSKPAAWVDYYGPVDGQTAGIAILNHPSSFRFPTHWHVRTYGLFAANPFMIKTEGKHTLAKDESLTLRYRVLLQPGDEKTGKVAEAFAAYANEGK